MHPSAMELGKLFFDTYVMPERQTTVVDIGAQNINGSLREVCPVSVHYIGVDCVAGEGVDIVLEDAYRLPFAEQSIDIVVCSSVFEHAEFFWELFIEIIRVLKPDGLLYINVPSNGYIHRYPVDCWRFYPDAGLALVAWARRQGYAPALLESFINERPVGKAAQTPSAIWNDFVAIFVKDQCARTVHARRLLEQHGGYRNAICDNPAIAARMAESSEDMELIRRGEEALDQALTQRAQLMRLLSEQELNSALASQALDALRASTSWRITRPLRWIAGYWRCSSFLPRLLSALRRRGNVRRWLRKLLNIRREEGLVGLLRRCQAHGCDRWRSRRQSGERYSPKDIPVIRFESMAEGFVPYQKHPELDPTIRLIAFYLPQYHPFPENDAWWGKGFTEWSNVCKAQPNFVGHHQPHLPIHFGYYDLRVPEVMEEQARLAKSYGISGFNYYFYWFAGKTLMDTPLERMLANPNVDIPFCLTWANENWTRRWDGQEQDVLIAQEHGLDDSLAFIRHLVKYFKDDRYIRIEGKPLLIIYRADIIPDMAEVARHWREEIAAQGFPGLYLICAQTFGIKGPEIFGFDAAMEFPPHTTLSSPMTDQVMVSNRDFAGVVFDYEQVAENAVRATEPEYKLFRSVMLSWDNTARKQNNSHIFHNFSLLRYKQWLSANCLRVLNSDKYQGDEQLVFINAWNEWAEGTHLEPDRKYGYGYLQATHDVATNLEVRTCSRLRSCGDRRKHPLAVIVHLHYPDVWPGIQARLSSLSAVGCDLYVSVTRQDLVDEVLEAFPEAFVALVENRGRDILPFLDMLALIADLGYIVVCKIHGKKSTYRTDGDKIRDEILGALIGESEDIRRCVSRFETDQSLGMLVPKKYLLAHSKLNMKYNQAQVLALCEQLGIEYHPGVFPAGSMFWFRAEALKALGKVRDTDFSLESGLCDGTLPHAIERVLCLLVEASGYRVEAC
ncbi:Lipopolysaccharide biosynthesis protein [Pseudomonas asplenii]|uniref:Lipopolysaccharide biosynthesis protein n=1 Tax=Pseudomonas asplenii TaxID=53407 RepID=A0A1H1WWI3_9PSED|nr:glycoside hydrolase family 99-like domain-containing protein [Pseudomonas asplenii]SDT01081.1 Lipopolysaccharide biosynthesis protein [Pseudomonas asplenii]